MKGRNLHILTTITLASSNNTLPEDGDCTETCRNCFNVNFNHLTPNGHYMGRTAQLTSRCYILYIYSTNIRTEYFKHAA